MCIKHLKTQFATKHSHQGPMNEHIDHSSMNKPKELSFTFQITYFPTFPLFLCRLFPHLFSPTANINSCSFPRRLHLYLLHLRLSLLHLHPQCLCLPKVLGSRQSRGCRLSLLGAEAELGCYLVVCWGRLSSF